MTNEIRRQDGYELTRGAAFMEDVATTPAQRRSAALTAAERAGAGGWAYDDLADVLGALGLDGVR